MLIRVLCICLLGIVFLPPAYSSDISCDPLDDTSTEEPDPEPDPLGNKSTYHPQGDPTDIFPFVLTEWRTVEIVGFGDVDVIGAFFDDHGHRLSVIDTGPDAGFRIVATLGPGQYFVAVEGANGATGEHALTLELVTWPARARPSLAEPSSE